MQSKDRKNCSRSHVEPPWRCGEIKRHSLESVDAAFNSSFHFKVQRTGFKIASHMAKTAYCRGFCVGKAQYSTLVVFERVIAGYFQNHRLLPLVAFDASLEIE